MSADSKRPNPGDWVAFYREARIVYAEVRYVDYTQHLSISTTLGAISTDSILEIRTHD